MLKLLFGRHIGQGMYKSTAVGITVDLTDDKKDLGENCTLEIVFEPLDL